VAARSKTSVYGHWLAGIAGSNSAGYVSLCCESVCCQVEVSAMG